MIEPDAILLETERMYFRQFRAEDGRLLFELDSDPEVMRFISKGRPTPLAKIQNETVPRILKYYCQSPPQGFWAAQLRQTDEFIGWFSLLPGKISPEETELGYRLKRGVWNRGLATEGVQALVENAFNKWGYEKISAHTMAANLASRRVMEKAGLAFEREFFYDLDTAHDWIEEAERRAVRYSVVRDKG